MRDLCNTCIKFLDCDIADRVSQLEDEEDLDLLVTSCKYYDDGYQSERESEER